MLLSAEWMSFDLTLFQCVRSANIVLTRWLLLSTDELGLPIRSLW